MSSPGKPHSPTASLLLLLTEHPNGLTDAELAAVAKTRFKVHPARVAALTQAAIAAGTMRRQGNRLLAFAPGVVAAPASLPTLASRPLRAVAIDVETVVRTTATEPYTDKRIFQLGAVRFGADAGWAGVPPLRRWVELPDDSWTITNEATRAAHATHALPPEQVLADFHDYTVDADIMVAYNGIEADFPLLTQMCDRHGLPQPGGRYVDGYYLTLCLWPTAPSHRLALLAEHVGIDTTDLRWHDAGADAELLVRLLRVGAHKLAGWPIDLTDLVASVGGDSQGWQLLRELAGDGTAVGTTSPQSVTDVAAVVTSAMTGHTPRRAPSTASRRPMLVDDTLRTGGQTDPGKLAQVTRGSAARRPAQEQMAATITTWANDGHGGLIEAPTGTGKSLAIVAAALDWLAAEPTRTVVIATYTKLLQNQLAKDLADLDQAVPGLLNVSDLVKGASNRLSLRALIGALADATAATGGARRQRHSVGSRFLEQPTYRELLIYLLLRLLDAHDALVVWAAHSVDPDDTPAFFAGYVGPALSVWLASLSQRTNGEYDPAATQPLAAHTTLVAEALSAHRLVLGNHALLLAHLDELAAISPDTLLIIDEAHQLEDAATGALTTELDYRAVEDLLGELSSWAAEQRSGPEAVAVVAAVRNLEVLLDHEQLPRLASLAFDARASGVGAEIGGRSVTLASPYVGSGGIRQVRSLAGQLTKLRGICESIVGALGAFAAARSAPLDFFAEERLRALITRTATVRQAAESIVIDIDTVLGPPPWARGLDTPPDPPAQRGDGGIVAGITGGDDEHGASSDASRDDDLGPDPDAGSDNGDGAAADGGDFTPVPVTSSVLAAPLANQVVFAEEYEALRAGLRRYRFRLATAPIDLPADPAWQRFLATFARTFYVSATLRVAGDWAFIRNRLGLPNSIRNLQLPTPFNLAEQAEVVCFSDFPSWAEQADGAMRTVAHQLGGYVRELVHPAVASPDDPDRSGYDGGALVLTTAKSTAGGISEHLASELRRRGDPTPLHAAIVTGNQRAVREFTDPDGGGLLVGTRGLWQGVDVADPHRVHLVWINKLPFAPFAAPIIETRRAAVAHRAELAGVEDPDAEATDRYYLPLAALGLRQAVGRLIRSERHRGVVVISDRKLAGATALRRSYRRTFLGSLDPGLLRDDPDTGEPGGGNVVTMADGWARIWAFLARNRLLDSERAQQLSISDALDEHTLLPQTRQIRHLVLSDDEVTVRTVDGTLTEEVLRRCAEVGGLLKLEDMPATLKPAQQSVIEAVATGQDVLGLLPTGFGKSFCFQLPALVLPGITLVISPLVALMHDQALELNRSIGGAVRAIIAPLRESSSRAGKTEVADQIKGLADHGIRLIYVSPERLAHTRFRELVRDGVAAGRIRRIVIDEAHTVVQWGDDFRPSYRRLTQLLRELREAGHPVSVSALTATANRSVHAGLRESVFGLAADPSDGEPLVTVVENPIRPELAIFRRSLNQVGPSTVAGLAEHVFDTLDNHAIFYCLTVKEVVALHAHLREYVGDANVRVRRFHGRLTEAEKSAVMAEFRESPRKGEEGFSPLVVVATSAFGLGINRPDIRTVFCVSVPTDMAALYQQLGRAGRDGATVQITGALDPSEDGGFTAAGTAGPPDPAPNTGLALVTTRGLRVAAFMTGHDLPRQLLIRMGQAVLGCREVLDPAEAAERLIAEDVQRGALGPDDASDNRTVEAYRTGVMRAFAALVDLGAVADHGDFPPLAAVKPGELLSQLPGSSDAEVAVVEALLQLPARGKPGQLRRSALDVVTAHRYLSDTVSGYGQLAVDPAATWQMLADLHDRGQLDVSAAPSRRLVTGLSVHTHEMPAGFATLMSRKGDRAASEISLLQDFFTDTRTCANRKFADYFGVVELPKDCCSSAENRCGACWEFCADVPVGQREPKSALAFATSRPRPAGSRTDTAVKARRLDEHVSRLLWAVDRGLYAADLWRALRGVDSWYHKASNRRVPLPNAVVMSRWFGANPSVTTAQINESLLRLQAMGAVVADGPRWRDTGNVARAARRVVNAWAAQRSVVTP